MLAAAVLVLVVVLVLVLVLVVVVVVEPPTATAVGDDRRAAPPAGRRTSARGRSARTLAAPGA